VTITLAEVAEDFHAGFFRHHEIQKHQVVDAGFESALPLGAIGGKVGFVAFEVKKSLKPFADFRFVVDDQNAAF